MWTWQEGLTLCKQNSSTTAERTCILNSENSLWLLLEANIQFTGVTRRCHCSQLPGSENDTKLNAFIRKRSSEELNGIRLHKAKCLLTLDKRCWSCWKVPVSSGTAGEGDVDKCARGRKDCFWNGFLLWSSVRDTRWVRSERRWREVWLMHSSLARALSSCSLARARLLVYGSLFWLKFYTAPKQTLSFTRSSISQFVRL